MLGKCSYILLNKKIGETQNLTSKSTQECMSTQTDTINILNHTSGSKLVLTNTNQKVCRLIYGTTPNKKRVQEPNSL